ncbi:hypothetical protein [Pseudomonas sp. H1h]|uniref:hypothetical protein n=2 Tax=Pseudomonas sp. H1h TaxID=1397280 RepID=UPI0012FEA8DD|nr:hypothetical protein [Pseudomonas sp. H1h]
MNKEGSFTGSLYISGYSLPCKLGFQYLDSNSTYSGRGFAANETGIKLLLPKTDYLCANTAPESSAALLHFEQTDNYGKYIITSRDPGFYTGCYLGITDNSYIFAYRPRSESNAFSFKRNGKVVTLNDMTEASNSDLELVCRDGGIELHKKAVYEPSQGKQWAAYVCTKGGDVGLIGPKITLKIAERNVE